MKSNNSSLRALMPLFLIIFIDTVGYFVVIPVIIRLFIHNEIHLLPTQTSLAARDFLYSLTLMLSPLAFVICSPLIGHASDRFGRKKALTGALIAACLGFLLPIIGILTRHISLILIGRAVAGASSSSQPVAQAGVTDFSIGKQRAMYLALIGFAMTLGMVVGPLSGSYLSDNHLVSWFNTTTPYWFALVLSVINVALLLIFYQDPPLKTSLHVHTPTSSTHWWRILTRQQAGVIMIAFLFMELAWSQYYQASFLFLSQHYHYTTNLIGIFTAYVGLSMCLGLTIVYRTLIRHLSIDNITRYSLLVATLGLIACQFHNMTIQWIAIFPTTVAIGTSYPSLLSMLSSRTDTAHQGYVLGCASTTLGVAWMMTGLAAGPLTTQYFSLPILLACIFMCVATLVIYSVRRL